MSGPVVRLENFTDAHWRGWKRATIDELPARAAGTLGDAVYVTGRQVGLATWVVDVLCSLAPGERRSIALDQAAPLTWERGPLPADPLAWFGGPATIGGQVLVPVGIAPDGAGYTAHMRARIGRMLACDLWVTWYPDQPGYARGELAITASNPAVPDMGETVPDNLRLAFGDALVSASLPASGTRFADGQSRIVPVVFAWPRHLHFAVEWASAGAATLHGIGAVGIRQLLADGNPTYPATFSARQWANAHLGPALRRLSTWEPSPIGPAQRSSDTGSQEDQVFVRGEALLPDGVGAELVAYAAALKMANRPCHHLEQDGRHVDPIAHPQALLWDGRPRFQISPDRLGKPRELNEPEAGGWWGPDVEHWLCNTLAAAARLTGSPACQWLLGHHARIYLAQRTDVPSWSTSAIFSSRELGWEGILVVHLWRELEDRQLAERVAQRWRDRLAKIILPRLGNAPGDIWDVRTQTSASLPIVPGWMPWQQAIGAYGVDLACRVLGLPDGSAFALRAAKRVLADAWVQEGGRLVEYERLSLAGDRSRSGYFVTAWLPAAVAVVLRHEPNHEKARAVWAQILADTANGSRSWVPPGVPA